MPHLHFPHVTLNIRSIYFGLIIKQSSYELLSRRTQLTLSRLPNRQEPDCSVFRGLKSMDQKRGSQTAFDFDLIISMKVTDKIIVRINIRIFEVKYFWKII